MHLHERLQFNVLGLPGNVDVAGAHRLVMLYVTAWHKYLVRTRIRMSLSKQQLHILGVLAMTEAISPLFIVESRW